MGSSSSNSHKPDSQDLAARSANQHRPSESRAASPFNRRTLLLALASLWAGGCATWKKDPEKETTSSPNPNLRTHRMANDSVILEIAMVDLSGDPQQAERIWFQIDETPVDPQIRQQLWNNGLRVGIAPSALPPELAQLLEEQLTMADVDPETGAMAPGIRVNQQRHQVRSGQAMQIATSPLQESLAWIVDDQGYRMGGTADQAECQFALRAYPRQDGSVRIKAIPEIHYGAARSSVDVTDNSMIFRPHRDKRSFTNLEMAVDMQSGQTMIIGTTPVGSQLGQLFLAQPNSVHEARNKVVLIRLGQVQLDDLFQRDAQFKPLETPVE